MELYILTIQKLPNLKLEPILIKMFKSLIFLFLPVFLFAGNITTIHLGGGNQISGAVIKETGDYLFIDIGHDVLKVPSHLIIHKSEEQKQKINPIAHEIYFEKPNAPTLPLNQLLEILGQSVVKITTPSGLGSGFIIHETGYIITNNHVIAGETKIAVTLFPKDDSLRKQFDNVQIMSSSPSIDLALLKIKNHSDYKFKPLPIGRTDSLKQGQAVFAIGSPLGLERSVSEGIISLKNRLIYGRLYIQTTTQINPGNSGGPLFNSRGEVIGVNNMKIIAMGAEGLGFSIPARVLKNFLKNREVYALDPTNPNSGFRYINPPK